MPFKTILVPTEQHDLMSSTLETAVVLARKFDSYIEGFALRVGVPVAFTIGDMGTLPVPAALEHEITDNENRTRALFEEFMREAQRAGRWSHQQPVKWLGAGCAAGRSLRRQPRPGL